MAESNSIQHKLTRVRPPRVKITYDVETGGAIEARELPFVVGILADLSGEPKGEAKSLKDRKFVDIDRDNFDDIMASITPRMKLSSVPNILPDAASDLLTYVAPTKEEAEKNMVKLPDGLEFTSIEAFTPMAVVEGIPLLSDFNERRKRLREFQAKLESSDRMMHLIERFTQEAAYGDTAPPEEGAEDRDKDIAGERAKLLAMFPAVPSEDGKTTEQMIKETWGATELPPNYGAFVKKNILNIPEEPPEDPEEKARQAKQIQRFQAILGQFVTDVLAPIEAAPNNDSEKSKKAIVGKKSATQLIDECVKTIDEILSPQLDNILHSKMFQKLESSWRGLHYLVCRTETSTMLKLHVLNVTQNELREDMQKAVEFDQSSIFKMVYEAEHGTFGGKPYSLLVGDFEFGRHPNDMTLLEKVTEAAASAHAPFISSAYSKLFDLASFEHLAKPHDLAKIFESADLGRWEDFRKSEDSRYATLTLPKVLLRLPYGEDTVPVEGLAYQEAVFEAGDAKNGGTPDATKLLWGNTAYFLAERVTHAFALYKWTAAIGDVEGGGLVEDLPLFTFKGNDGDKTMICPTQVGITDRCEKELNELGFMAICHCKGSTSAAFFGGQTTNRPKKYFGDDANADANLSARLPYILAASRFAHYVKVIVRDKVGSFMTRANVEAYLNNWISNFVLLDDDASQMTKAAYPLREASIRVTEVPGNPGAYKATMFLKPHFQLEELTTSIRLVTNIPA